MKLRSLFTILYRLACLRRGPIKPPPAGNALVIYAKGPGGPPTIAYIGPDVSPDRNRLVIVRPGGIGDFRIVRRIVSDADDLDFYIRREWRGATCYLPQLLGSSSPLSRLQPSLEAFANLIAKGGGRA